MDQGRYENVPTRPIKVGKPQIVTARDEQACILADSLDDAMRFARSRFGDYRVDYRNGNVVEFDRETTDEHYRYFYFTVKHRG